MSGEPRVRKRLPRFDLSRTSDRTALIAIIAAALLALLVWAPFNTAPGDPAAVSGDPRLVRCDDAIGNVEYAFAIPKAADYQRYLPAMPKASELDLPNSALVVIYKSGFVFGGGSPSPGPDASTTLRMVCIYVGEAGRGELNYYTGVSIAGLRATLNGPTLVPAVQT